MEIRGGVTVSSSQGRPLILSVSRRTDLVGWYAEETAERIRTRVRRARTRYLYGVAFWTRFPMNLVKGPLATLLDGQLDNVAVNLTLTGLGGSPLEPRAPRTEEVLLALKPLKALLSGQGERIRWRFDPLLYGHITVETFERLADFMAGLGVNTCTFSFPAERSLRGYLAGQYRTGGVRPWPGHKARAEFLGRLCEVAGPLGIRMLSCSQPDNVEMNEYVQPAQCIPMDVLRDLHPRGEDYPDDKDGSQRKHCTCPESEDMGRYGEDLCRTGCVYCYSPSGGPEPLKWKPRFSFGGG